MAADQLLFDDKPHGTPERVGMRRGLLLVFALFLATRMVIWVGAYSGAMLHTRFWFDMDPPLERHRERMQDLHTDSELRRWADSALYNFNPLLNFDGRHYHSIVVDGYRYVQPKHDEHLEQNIAFFPLYPLICQPLVPLVGANASMVLVSHGATLLASLLLYVWIRTRIDHAAALLAVACTLMFPAACYLAFGYAEAVMLLLVVLVCWLIDRRHFWAAAVACGLATASRPTAIIIVPVLLLAYWLQSRGEPRKRLATLAGLTALAGAGIACYALFLWWAYGSPFVYSENFRNGWVHTEQRAQWYRYLLLVPVWEHLFKGIGSAVAGFPTGLVHLAAPRAWNMPLTFFLLFVSLGGMLRVPRGFRPLLWAGPFMFAYAYLASGGANFGITPIARYMSTAVPVFVVLGVWMAREWTPTARTTAFVFMALLQFTWALCFGLREWPG